MLRCFLTTESALTQTDALNQKGVWISLVAPTAEEISRTADATGVLPEYLRAALDEEERSRIESEGQQVLTLIHMPVLERAGSALLYDTMPLGVIATPRCLVTVALEPNEIISGFEEGRGRPFWTYKRSRLLLQIMFATATLYLRYLRRIDRHSSEIEAQLQGALKNEQVIRLLNLSKSLVYFTTSLRANQLVMEKLMRSQLKKAEPEPDVLPQTLAIYPEDEDLLEDVIIENRQAIEMAETYSNTLSGLMDAFASVISNNLNIVMKFLTSVTIILALPTMVASFWGMNVRLPFGDSAWGMPVTLALSFLLSLLGYYMLKRRHMI